MGSNFGKVIVIANSRAGKGSFGSQRERYESLLAGQGLDFEIRTTLHRGHASELARQALDEGHRFIVAIGGDGTIHEVVNGMMGPNGPLQPDAILGVVPAGSGSDFIKTFGLPPEPEDTVKHLSGENLFPIDVGKITYTVDGAMVSRYFPNIAEAGLGGDVVRRAERLPRRLGRVRYLLGFWMTLGRFKPQPSKILLDNRSYEGPVTNLVVANCQFFGGGMRIAPKAHPADGKFDVLVQKGTKMDYVAGITKVYKGEHLPSPAIREYLVARVEIESETPLQVEADGEVLGTTPAVFEVVPGAINLKI